MEHKASFWEDAYSGIDFWEVDKTFEQKVRVIAETETPEEEPLVSFTRAVLDKKGRRLILYGCVGQNRYVPSHHHVGRLWL